MRILLSAYACEPGKGSEPGVGWGWARALARAGHEVHVLTRANNRPGIECALAEGVPEAARLHFLYYDLPSWANWWKKGGRGVHLYYFLWQVFAARVAMHSHTKLPFDVVHHVTFVSIRQPSFLGALGVPLIFGPVAGGERAPMRLRAGFGWKAWFWDGIRDAVNAVFSLDPFVRRTLAQAVRIYVTSTETLALVPEQFRSKARIQLAIALDSDDSPQEGAGSSAEATAAAKPLRVLYVGRFVDLKGMDMGLCAFSELLKHHPDARLTMVGDGPAAASWRRLAAERGIAASVDWIRWMPQSQLGAVYRQHDIFLFPSLRDSGGLVVLEAMAEGVPAVCFRLGGPGAIVDETCGRSVDASGVSVAGATDRLAQALIELAGSSDLRQRLSAGARRKAHESVWEVKVQRIYEEFEQSASPLPGPMETTA